MILTPTGVQSVTGSQNWGEVAATIDRPLSLYYLSVTPQDAKKDRTMEGLCDFNFQLYFLS